MRRLTIPVLMAFALIWGCDNPPATTDGGPLSDAGPNTGVDGGPSIDSGPTCIDLDEDGYGDGCAPGLDCNDNDNSISPAATDTCDGVDNNCDGTTDEGFVAPSCSLTEGVCAGALATCGATGIEECGTTEYGATYEADESLCDGLDNDCDGTTDEGCTCISDATQACGLSEGVCMAGTQTCVDSEWAACEGEVSPMGEVCDGLDNDCDGNADESADLSAPACPLQQGVCAGSGRRCGGVAGWIACTDTSSYGGDYQPAETLCDTLDNDCDGIVDEGCACIDGATQECGTDVGVCMAGVQTCTLGAWGGCAGEVASTDEICNGLDDNCSGDPDEDLLGEACPLQEGVCAGSAEACGGVDGFEACTTTNYGPRYEASETSCDGFDNDCNGITDEGCDCIDGTTQECGTATGVCERGIQTCVLGAFGDCEGAVSAVAELCNGMDDNCDGNSDEDDTVAIDGLSATACPLQEGVCAGSTEVCAGAAGWTSCDTNSYGSQYVDVEDGAVDGIVCDGLDNDCDGVTDEGCPDQPLVERGVDLAFPYLDDQYLVYSQRFDDNWDVVFMDLSTGVERRLTTTDADETFPRVSGHFVVFSRGPRGDARPVLYDLSDESETELSMLPSNPPQISGHWVVYDGRHASGNSDVFVHDLSTGAATEVLGGSGGSTNEWSPRVRGDNLIYSSDAGTYSVVHYVDLSAGTWTPVAQVPSSIPAEASFLFNAETGYNAIGWTDGRTLMGTPAATDDYDLWGSAIGLVTGVSSFPGDNLLSIDPGNQRVTSVESMNFIYDDVTVMSRNVGMVDLDGGLLFATTGEFFQGGGTMSGAELLWMDGRLGPVALYHQRFSPLAAVPANGDVMISELLADPAPDADVNGDGIANTTQDEFVEVRNMSFVAMDLSGMTISDAAEIRYTFPADTILPAQHVFVVFGGGTVVAPMQGAQSAVSSLLGLSNGGDTVTLELADGTEIDTVTYGRSPNDQSMERSSTGALVAHSAVPGASAEAQSPGLTAQGFGF